MYSVKKKLAGDENWREPSDTSGNTDGSREREQASPVHLRHASQFLPDHVMLLFYLGYLLIRRKLTYISRQDYP
jgi:hypothetical protein